MFLLVKNITKKIFIDIKVIRLDFKAGKKKQCKIKAISDNMVYIKSCK